MERNVNLMKFELKLLKPLTVETKTIDGKRFYIKDNNPTVAYPSVTTFLSQIKDSKFLDEWVARLGVEETDRIRNRSARRGSGVHLACENYLMNNPQANKGMMPSNKILFDQVKKVLDAHITEVYGIELPVFSAYLCLGGRVDLVASFDGVKSVIDFKTSNFHKKEEYLEGYYLQETAYSIMMEENYKIALPQIVTIVACESEREAQIVVRKRDEFAPRLLELVKDFRNGICNTTTKS